LACFVLNQHSTTNVSKVKPEGKIVYLTFDDGPSEWTEEFLDVLQQYDVKATFFYARKQFAAQEFTKCREACARRVTLYWRAQHDSPIQ
jgi:hypothetical protein